MGAEVNWALVRRPRSLARFDVQTNLDTAHVACLRIFPGIKPEMLDSVLRVPNLRGLILETFGAGNAPSGADGSMVNVIKSAVARGIVIVNVSQCQSTSKFVKSKVSQSQQHPSLNEQNSALPRHRRTFCTRCKDWCPNRRCH